MARKPMKRVIIESPFAGDRKTNLNYLGAAIRDCINRGESPYASHGLIPLGLDDNDPRERDLGIRAGFEWRQVGESTLVYADFGISTGMGYGVKDAEEKDRPVFYRIFPFGLGKPAEEVKVSCSSATGQIIWTAELRGKKALNSDKGGAIQALSPLRAFHLAKFQALQRLAG